MKRKIDNRAVSSKIYEDIERGIYSRSPKAKERLSYLANRLLKIEFVLNERELSYNETSDLKRYGYL